MAWDHITGGSNPPALTKGKNCMICLVLNLSYEFLGFCTWESAICSVVSGKATVEEEYDRVVRSPSTSMNVPAVIRIKHYVRVAYHKITYVSYNKRNVHLRDNYICQYCNVKVHPKEIGIDHVIPESRGGKKTWDNTVSACYDCNIVRKRDRTPAEAGMTLIRIPGRPKGFREIVRVRCGEIHDLWLKYL